MTTIDWCIVCIPLLVVLAIALYTRRYLRSVADFMAGGRCAGRYLLATARSEMGSGAAVFVALFEIISKSGFAVNWWGTLTVPVGLVMALTGFVAYRYRETRAMTLAQFFEIRYSRGFRLFAGVLAFFAGILNFGIIPSIGARFFVYFLGLPDKLNLFGFQMQTFVLLMGGFLAITLLVALSGGQITMLVADCVEGMFSQFGYVIIAITLVLTFSWTEIREVLMSQPPTKSFVNPFDSFGLRDFNIWYVLMSTFIGIYGTMAWQNSHGFNSSGLSAHEARMGGIVGVWRNFARAVMLTLLGICALTYLTHTDYAAGAAHVQQTVSQIDQKQIGEQMRIPIAIREFLPIGVKGLFCMIVLMGVISGDGMHLHSWGSIFVQDVLVPLRKTPFSPEQHIRVLRMALVGVAIFAFLFGSLFHQTEYVVMWFNVTASVFIGGAGSAIIGGLYWKKATAAGAWAGMVTGCSLSLGGIVMRQVDSDFPLNGTAISFVAALISIGVYVVVSLITCREDYNMERLLHRGKYAREDTPPSSLPVPPKREPSRLQKLIGLDEDFTRGDRWLAGSVFWWTMFWFVVFVVVTLINMFVPAWRWSDDTWAAYWHITAIILPLIIGVLTTIWFTIGGTTDLIKFFRRLKAQRIDHRDDGTVVAHRNLDEVSIEAVPPETREKVVELIDESRPKK
jgi:SSS family solute:Na+ symporter